SQDVELFDMTLYDNIVMGKRVPAEKLQKVIDGCCLNELIARMNGNLHTDIGEKGVKVSAGEKQRISLARGLLLDRDILVLDEITANLDPATTQNIWNYIFSAYGDKTIIAVSHEKDLLNHVSRKLEFKKGIGTESK
ncbi:MAG: ATP-binding cassette domain-containing protein, partial [Alphaproteobacteria bacterium]|nr:ATP-binding cassette domain-containing protein [Alphaproteobacteria bacterium]